MRLELRLPLLLRASLLVEMSLIVRRPALLVLNAALLLLGRHRRRFAFATTATSTSAALRFAGSRGGREEYHCDDPDSIRLHDSPSDMTIPCLAAATFGTATAQRRQRLCRGRR